VLGVAVGLAVGVRGPGTRILGEAPLRVLIRLAALERFFLLPTLLRCGHDRINTLRSRQICTRLSKTARQAGT
jgi:hypothetical protein